MDAAIGGQRPDYQFHPEVSAEECRRIRNRRQAMGDTGSGPPSPEQTVGLALSGGGIRSATFCLGVVQSLARRHLLKGIDYISTVSGGGYAGSFLGSHFLPESLRQGGAAPTPEEFRQHCRNTYEELRKAATPTPPSPKCAGVRSALVPGIEDAGSTSTSTWSGNKALQWLRTNGRYLAPRGTGDLIYVVGMQIRNWAAVQYVVGIMILFLLVAFSTLRAWLVACSELWRRIEALFLPETGAAIYWSPGWILVGASALITLLPPALAYWLAHSRVDDKRIISWLPLWHAGAIGFLLLLGLTWAYGVLVALPRGVASAAGLAEMPKVAWAAATYVVISLLAVGNFLAGLDYECRGRKSFWTDLATVLAAVVFFLVLPTWRGAEVTHSWMWRIGVLLVAILVVRSILRGRGKKPDPKSLRTRFTLWLGFWLWVSLGGAGLALLGTIGQTAYAYVRLEPGVGRVAGLASVVAAVVAGARQLFKWLGSGSKQTHPKIPLDALAGAAALLLVLLTGGAWATLVQAALWKGGPPAAAPVPVHPDSARTWAYAATIDVSPWKAGTGEQVELPLPDSAVVQSRPVAIAPGWMTVFFVGMIFLFVTTGMFLNFINMSSLHQFYTARLGRAYLGATNRERFTAKGVSSVTTPLPTDAVRLKAYYHRDLAAPVHLINVTVNQTRPPHDQLVQRDRKGMSMAVGPGFTLVNSAVFARDDKTGNLTPKNDESAKLAGQDPAGLREFNSEELDVGDWCAISGAAFSTGLGMRTSLGLSLLAGLANVRLGYWWNFNTERRRTLQLSAYRYLWGELMADFRGPWKPFWFLTDGGHFDNTGVYELVRRRVGVIVLCDNGCDPGFRFQDLGNLARKIRTDFDAELRPLTPPATKYFATQEEFADPLKRSGKCALLYEISYPAPPGKQREPGSLLIVLKPNLIAEAPIDVAEYGAANSPFPHQSTLDQFFDDAQWESYRKLGEKIADVVLDDAAALEVTGWRRSLLKRTQEAAHVEDL